MDILVLFFISIVLFVIILATYYIYKSLKQQKKFSEIEFLIKKGNYKQALNLASTYLKEKKSFLIYYMIAQAYEGLNDITNAIKFYEEALTKFAHEYRRNTKIDLLIKIGDLYAKNGELISASGNYIMALNENPNEYRALYALGNMYYKGKNYQKAAFYLEKLVQVKPENWNAHYLLGRIHYYQNNFRKAIIELENTLKLNISDSSSRNNITLLLADIYTSNKNYRESIVLLRPLMERNDTFNEAFIRILKNLVLDNQLQTAIEMGNRYMDKITPNIKHQVLYMLGQAYFYKKDFLRAIDCWSKAYHINPDYADLKDLMVKYKALVENPLLEDYFTPDENAFIEFIIKCLHTRILLPGIDKNNFKIFKSDDNQCHIFFRLPSAITPADLKEIENTIRQELLGSLPIILYSLFGTVPECKADSFYKKVNEISGDQFIKIFASTKK